VLLSVAGIMTQKKRASGDEARWSNAPKKSQSLPLRG
jgi:hypothetical protein